MVCGFGGQAVEVAESALLDALLVQEVQDCLPVPAYHACTFAAVEKLLPALLPATFCLPDSPCWDIAMF